MSARRVIPKAATASRQPELSANDIANLIQLVALELLGEPNKALSSKRELRFGNNGSLAVTIAGEGAGQWYSFEEGRGGGVLDLITREHGGTRATAIHWLKQQSYGRDIPVRAAGVERHTRPQQRRRARSGAKSTQTDKGETRTTAAPGAPQRQVENTPPPPLFPWQQNKEPELDTRAEALELWRAAWPIDGTPAALYLRRRGLDPLKLMRIDLPGEWPETLRFSTAYPGIALVVAVHDARTGLVCAVQRIFLKRDGRAVLKSDAHRNVAPEGDKKIKLSLGPIDGNAARFSGWPDPQGRWGIAEGPETALSAQQLLGFPVWSAIHAGNMAKIDPPEWASEAFVFADHDDAGMEAATATATRLSKMPSIRRVQMIRAVASGADVADVLKEHAP
jgi:hypothetical protein